MNALKRHGIVQSSADFSTDWLGRERSYLRGLSTKNRRPSTEVWAICAVRLLKRADSAEALSGESPFTLELRRLADRCLDEVLTAGMRPVTVTIGRYRLHKCTIKQGELL